MFVYPKRFREERTSSSRFDAARPVRRFGDRAHPRIPGEKDLALPVFFQKKEKDRVTSSVQKREEARLFARSFLDNDAPIWWQDPVSVFNNDGERKSQFIF